MGINSNNYGSSEQDRQNEILRQFIQGAQKQSEMQLNNAHELGQMGAKNTMQQGNQAKNLGIANDLIKNHKGPGKLSVGLDANGGVNESQAEIDPLARLLSVQKHDEANQAKLDKGVTGMTDRVAKSQLIPLQGQLADLQGAKKDGHFVSIGGLKNLAPDFAVGLAEKLGLMPPGSNNERQNLAGVRNNLMHKEYGSRQTEVEGHNIANELGLHVGASEADIQEALKRVGGIAASDGQNILHGTNPAAITEFQKRGGRTDFAENPFQNQAGVTKTPPAPPAKPQSVKQNGVIYHLNPQTGQYE